MRRLTTQHGFTIAAKLDAPIESKRGHDFVRPRVDGQPSGQYGLLRGSNKKSIAIDKAAPQIGLSSKEFRGLADCTFSKEDYEEAIRQRRRDNDPRLRSR